ncbi:MAG: M20/M25/M40 family metallo-hydrolase [Oscillospiraceae bacterium]|jgi:carboxypeptidase PM20D1|nr:M20/M25/M40 family metallo-hydrolase [Oscillospiraceae bacterium]
MKKAWKILPVAAAGAAAGALVAKAAKFTPEKRDATPFADEKVDVERFMKNLSGAIQIPTISYGDPERVDWAQFEAFHSFLEESYPLVHKTLTKEVVGRASLLYRWAGKNPALDPIAMLAHQDVVPVSKGTEQDWKYPPFSGEIAEGHLWGRGTLDMKNHLIGVMEAVEALLEDGFVPERDVYLCFGHDEEVMSTEESGAVSMMKVLKSRGVHLDAILDEGGAILPVKVKGVIDKNLAGVGIAEKGYVDFEISVNAKGGHSSQPPKHTALGELADVIKDIENNQFKAKMIPMVQQMFTTVGRSVSLPARIVTSNIPMLKPVLTGLMTQIPPAASMVRTTTAVTMASGSPSENVLPQKASINVNLRIMPGMTIQDVEDHLRRVIRNKNVEIRYKKGKNPSAISPTDSRAFKAIEDICYRTNQKNVVTPFLVMGGTDACRYEPICENIYRYSPFYVNTSLLLTAHGTNERIPTTTLADGVVFFKRYIRTLAGE